MRRPTFSIVTVTYNSEKTVEQTIKSVLSQSFTDFEYIIVDGASKDGTVGILEKYAKEDNRVRFISEPDKGIYDAMNKGLGMTSGKAVALLNSDDYYVPDALEKISRYLPECEKYVVYGMVRILEHEKESEVILSSHNSLPRRMMMHPGCFVSRDIYDQYTYDTSYKSAADYDLFLRLYRDSEVTFIPVYDVIANFRLGGMSDSTVSYIESNDVRCKYGYISKRQKRIRNLAIKVKRCLLRRK
ncbi:MAG: glycosyltransferase [Lachnospiraceae bacterium]|nr:glycosyltransferase [Lachnospiraceae bacterium]